MLFILTLYCELEQAGKRRIASKQSAIFRILRCHLSLLASCHSPPLFLGRFSGYRQRSARPPPSSSGTWAGNSYWKRLSV